MALGQTGIDFGLARAVRKWESGSSENRSSHRIDVPLFLELEEELGLFGKITLSFLEPGNCGRVHHIFILGDDPKIDRHSG